MTNCSGPLLTNCRLGVYLYYPVYGLSRRQEEGQPTLLLRRRKRARRGQAPHRPPGVSRYRRQGRRARQGPYLSSSSVRRVARLRVARCPVARSRANRSVWRVGDTLACIAIRPFASPLPPAGGHPPHLSTGTQDPGGRLVRAKPFCIPSGEFRRNASPPRPSGMLFEKILPEHL